MELTCFKSASLCLDFVVYIMLTNPRNVHSLTPHFLLLAVLHSKAEVYMGKHVLSTNEKKCQDLFLLKIYSREKSLYIA